MEVLLRYPLANESWTRPPVDCLLECVLEEHHKKTLIKLLRHGLQLGMSGALLVIEFEIGFRCKRRDDGDGEALVSLVFECRSGGHGENVWLAVLEMTFVSSQGNLHEAYGSMDNDWKVIHTFKAFFGISLYMSSSFF